VTKGRPAAARFRHLATSVCVATGVTAAIVVGLVSCGRAPAESVAVSFQGPSTNAPASAASPTPRWSAYNDTEYQFVVRYPPGFTLQRLHGVPGTGLLMVYRIIDNRYIDGYPLGQIEISIYTRDAVSLRAWVAKHSGQPASSDLTRYWSPVANQSPVKVGGRDGLSFDWVPDRGGRTIHAVAVFQSTAHVLILDWWSFDPSYGVSLQQFHQQMLSDLRA
jgi:hypothetical protein